MEGGLRGRAGGQPMNFKLFWHLAHGCIGFVATN
jgi:hypothetical protein